MAGHTTVAELSRQPFFRGIPPDTARHVIAAIVSHARRVHLHADDRIFVEGEAANRWWIIMTGHIVLEIHVPGRGQVSVETLGPGQVLGWSWLFPPYRWRLGAYVLTETEAWEFDAKAIRERCQTEPEFGRVMYERFAELAVDRLQATRMRLVEAYSTSGRMPTPDL